MFEIYRSRLSIHERFAYDSLKKGIINFQQSIKIYFISFSRITHIFNAILMDHPELFYTKEFKLSSSGIVGITTIFPVYTYTSTIVKELISECNKNIQNLLDEIKKLDDYNKELKVHDFLCKKVKYSNELEFNSHSIIGPLVYGLGVCEGIAKATKYIFDLVKIESFVVYGKARNQSLPTDELHAWNIVKINKDYYHLDITFDNTTSKINTRYDYFNLKDDEVLKDHYDYDSLGLICNRDDLSYFKKNNLIMNRQEDFEKYFKQQVINCNNYIIFKIPNAADNKLVINKITSLIKKVFNEARTKFTSYEINYNELQLVFEIILK